MSEFPHLHVHSCFSVLDGVPTPSKYLEACQKKGMKSIALTEHGNMGSHIEFGLESKKFEVKPIFGLEAYLSEDISRINELRDKSKKKKKNNEKEEDESDELKSLRKAFHIVLLAKDKIGYNNLIKLNNFSWTKGFYYKNRIDLPMLREHKDGLICLTACQSGFINHPLINGDLNLAEKRLKEYIDIFEENLFIELQFLDMEVQDVLNKELITLGSKYDLPFVLTNDVHYIGKKDYRLQSLLIDMSTMSSKKSGEKFKMDSRVNFLKKISDFEDDLKTRSYINKSFFRKMIDNCFMVSDRCNYSLEFGKLFFPSFNHKEHFMYSKFPIEDKNEFFKKMTIRRAKKVLGNALFDNDIYKKRLAREMATLFSLGAVDYFLICDDLLHFIRQKGAFSMIRGSANGSLVAFVLEFGLIDPVRHGILFERFISKYRSLNDIDIDIDIRSEFRSEAISYLKNKYGEDRVISVGTYNRMKLKGAIKDVTRVLKDRIEIKLGKIKDEEKYDLLSHQKDEYSFQTINRITSAMDNDLSVEEALEQYPIFKDWNNRNLKIMDKYIKPLIGNVRNISLHPAGMVITPGNVDEILPIRTQTDSQDKTKRVISTVWENSHTGREDLNEVGVMTLDILGVKTLSIVSEVISLVKKIRGIDINLYKLDLEDKKTLAKFNKGEVVGVFQFSGSAASKIIKNTKITEFNDLIVINALARPGALLAGADVAFSERKADPDKVFFEHESLKPILGDSLGVIVFSEHILRTASEFAGMPPKDADRLRKIIKSKDGEAFQEYKELFISGCIKKWKSSSANIEDIAENLWIKFSEAGSYLFPRGHAASYALLGFICMYLKVYYPVEFFSCHLRYLEQDKYQEAKDVAEEEYGIKFKMPNVNKPTVSFEPDLDSSIIWPISAIKNVGEKALDSILTNAPFSSLEDFYSRIDKRVCNKRVIENLIIAGAFSDFSPVRNAVWKKYSSLAKYKEGKGAKINPAFSSMEAMRLAEEDVFGFEVKPLALIYKKKLKEFGEAPMNYEDFQKASSGSIIRIFGRISRITKIKTKNDEDMAFVDIKSGKTVYNITLFPKAYGLLSLSKEQEGEVVFVSGTKNIWNKKMSIVLETTRGPGKSAFENGNWIKFLK